MSAVKGYIVIQRFLRDTDLMYEVDADAFLDLDTAEQFAKEQALKFADEIGGRAEYNGNHWTAENDNGEWLDVIIRYNKTIK